MELIIKSLSTQLMDDYLYFFDNVDFTDNPDWAGCYCTYYHISADENPPLDETGGKRLREHGAKLIKDGILKGYLAYDGQRRVVGWCNPGDKASGRKQNNQIHCMLCGRA